jgi:cob(I)alamin adenosyltransferase
MKLTIEHDNGKTEVFQDVTDIYLACRTLKSIGTDSTLLSGIPEIRSYSWGNLLRELTKEVQQSLIELQDELRKQREKQK